MGSFSNNISRRKIKIVIQASYCLVRQYIQLLLENDDDINILDVAITNAELLQKVRLRHPDVVLLCLMKDEGKNIEIVANLLESSPDTKVMVLSSPNSSLDQTEALKLGVTGIVGANQNARMLVRAIKQVSEGEVWLNQKLIAQLLSNNLKTAKKTAANHANYPNDDLTNREIEVVGLIGLGLRNKNISNKLFISEATVRHHLSSIYSKLQIEDRLNLAIYAHRERIVERFAKSI